MDLQTYDEATRLLDRYRLCEKVIAYLTDNTTAKGQGYMNTIARFFDEYRDEMLVTVNDLMTKAGMEFENLHCECRPMDNDNSTEQENPKS